MRHKLLLESFPFYIGPMVEPRNPPGVPSVLDFELAYDDDSGLVTQLLNEKTSKFLRTAYRIGNELGNPLSETGLGKPYADDFIRVIKACFPLGTRKKRALEIGAGTGYLLSRIADLGFDAIGIEPGVGYAHHWLNSEMKIVNDFFPSSKVTEKFDLICAYMVLEHIEKPMIFLRDIVSHLKSGGVAIIAVPDCTEELIIGDASILIHEHINYFDSKSLRRLCNELGLHVEVTSAAYGRSLYAVIQNSIRGKQMIEESPTNHLATFSYRVQQNIGVIRTKLLHLASLGSLGIFCPARALHLLTPDMSSRFFDDDVNQQNKYIPPFGAHIESRENLIKVPVDNLVIMSRTFGVKISESLRRNGYRGNIHLVSDFYSS